MSGDEDSPEARAARAAERRREADAAARAQAQLQLQYQKDEWRGLQRACAPWGWAFDGLYLYMVGFGFIMTAYLVLWAAFMFLEVSFVGFFDALGPASTVWFPTATIAFGIALPVLLRAIATPAANRAIDAELAWLAALPFPTPSVANLMKGYGASAGAHGGGKLRVTLYYERDRERPTERAHALCVDASIPATVSAHFSDELRIEMAVAGGSDYKVGRNVRLLFHDLAIGVLTPLYAEARFTRVELSS